MLWHGRVGIACRDDAGQRPGISTQAGHRPTADDTTQSPALNGPMIHLTMVNAKYPRYACGYFLACVNMVRHHAHAWTYGAPNARISPTTSAVCADYVRGCYERPTAAVWARHRRRRFYETSLRIAYTRGEFIKGKGLTAALTRPLTNPPH